MRRPLRSLVYLLSSLPVAVAWLLATTALLGPGVLTAPLGIGAGLLVAAALSGLPLGALERWRLRLVIAGPLRLPHRPPDAPGFPAAIRARLGEPATWRALAYGPLLCVLGAADAVLALSGLLLALGLVTAPLQAELLPFRPNPAWARIIHDPVSAGSALAIGLAWAVLAALALTLYARGRAAVARALIVAPPDQDLAPRIVSAFDAERRRIERDLHDGVQQRADGVGDDVGAGPDGGGGRIARGPRAHGSCLRGGEGDAHRAQARGARHPPLGARRPRAGGRDHGGGGALPGAGRDRPRARRPAARPDRVGGLPHHLRGAHERRPPQRRHGGDRPGQHRPRPPPAEAPTPPLDARLYATKRGAS